jgi:Protein of unknown function (DUF3710)
VIFSRGRGRGRHSHDDGARRRGRHAGPDDAGARDPDGVAAGEEHERDEVARTGPYDLTEAPTGVERIDLGSLKIPSVNGVEVRVQASQDGVVQQVVLVHGDSALQLGVFAAPRSSGIWDEVRAEIRKSLANAQSVREVDGAYGPELRARVRTPEGVVDLRFLGVDGPRWMVQALFQGRAAADPSAAGPLTACLEGLVVDRGKEAMPVREPLPLRLPRDVAEQAAARAGEGPPGGPRGAGPAGAGPGGAHRGIAGPAGTSAGDAAATRAVNGRPPEGGGGGPSTGSGGAGGSRRGPRPKPSPRPRRST